MKTFPEIELKHSTSCQPVCLYIKIWSKVIFAKNLSVVDVGGDQGEGGDLEDPHVLR